MKYLKNVNQIWDRLDESWKFAITAFVIARGFFAVWSWIILTIQPVAVHYVEVNHQAAVIFLDLHTSRTFTYFREMQGNNLDFKSIGVNMVADQQAGSQWDIRTGGAIDGQYQGSNLIAAIYPIESIFPYYLAKPYSGAWLSLWQRFDANVYLTIADNGYGKIGEDTHFPPLYPMLIAVMTFIFRNSFLAGLFISHIATLYSLKLLYEIFSKWEEPSAGKRAVAYLLLFPASFFFFSVYTESIFLMTTLLSMRSMSTRSWAWAGFWAFCAILTRLPGMALLPPMLYLMWKDAPFLRKLNHWVGLAIPGLAALFYLYLRSTEISTDVVPLNEPLWHAKLVLPWESYLYAFRIILSGHFNYIDVLNLAAAILFTILFFSGLKKIPIEYSLFSGFSLLIILIRIVENKAFNSMLRFSLTLFPLYFVLGLAGENSRYRRIIIYTFIALNLYLSQEFFGWGWVA